MNPRGHLWLKNKGCSSALHDWQVTGVPEITPSRIAVEIAVRKLLGKPEGWAVIEMQTSWIKSSVLGFIARRIHM
jgi:hypothetical protein